MFAPVKAFRENLYKRNVFLIWTKLTFIGNIHATNIVKMYVLNLNINDHHF